MRKVVSVLLSLISILCISFTFGGCDKTEEVNKTELSEEDLNILKYYQEPTLEMDFVDNVVWVILKSSYNDLEEISFKDLKIVEKVSRISYIEYKLKKYRCEDEKFALQKSKNHMFDIVLEEHSKEKVLAVIDLLQTLDMVLCAGPDFIYGITNT